MEWRVTLITNGWLVADQNGDRIYCKTVEEISTVIYDSYAKMMQELDEQELDEIDNQGIGESTMTRGRK